MQTIMYLLSLTLLILRPEFTNSFPDRPRVLNCTLVILAVFFSFLSAVSFIFTYLNVLTWTFNGVVKIDTTVIT